MPNDIRVFETDYNPDIRQSLLNYSDCSFLALSGGGANGAFGAGVLCGWTETGTRPTFQVVTGTSTGALISPFAFLGSDYDDELRKAYTTIESKDIFDVRGLFGVLEMLWNESYADTKPLSKLIANIITKEKLAAIAKEYARGRRLYIGTTNLDAKIILASSAFPGVFPPVCFDVEAAGEKYDEMYVDGGVITGMFSHFKTLQISGRTPDKPCSVYVIKNGKVVTEYEQVPRNSLKILCRSFSTLMKAQSWSDLNRIYNSAQTDGVEFNYISIPDDGYTAHGKEIFDRKEMKRFFDMGFEMGKAGNKWQKSSVLW
jgi:hypothetical protein